MSEALAAVDGELTVNVKTINSEVYQFTLNNNTTVNEFKSLIRQRTDISEDRQRLIYRGKVLTDGTTVGEYHIESGHTVQFVARPENYRELQQSAASAQSNGTAPAPAVNIVQQTALDQMMRDIFGGETAGAVTEATRQGGLFGPSGGTPVALPAMDDGSMEHIRQGFLTLRTILATIGDPSITSEVNGHLHSGPHPRYYLGQWLDVKDTVNQWLEATVMNVDHQSNAIFVHYNGWPSRWDEWIPFNSPRIAPFRSRTAHSTALTSYVSPTPNVRIAGAPSTGTDDIRTLLPEIRNMMRRLQPMIEEAADIAEQSYLEEHPTATPGLLIGNPEAERSITASSVMFSRPRGNSAPSSGALSGRSGDIWSESEVRQAPIASSSSSSSSGGTNGIRSGAAPAPRLTQRFPLSFSPTRQVHVNTSTDNNNNSSSSGRSNGGDASTAAAAAAVGHDDISGGGAGVGLFNITSTSTTTLPPDLMSILTPLLGAASTEPSPVNTTTSGVGVAPVGSTFMVGSDGSVRVRQPTSSSTSDSPSAASVSAVSGTTANLVSPASGESSSGSFDATTTSATATAAAAAAAADDEYSDFLSTLLRSFAAASAVTSDPAMSAAAAALRGDNYGDDSDGDEYADNEGDEESEDQSDRDEVPDLEEVRPDGTTQIVHRRSERSERSDSSSSSRDANTRDTMNAADAAASSVSESREARLRTLCGELCPLLDRFGRVLSDTSPFLRTYSQAPSSSGSSASGTGTSASSSAPASAVPSVAAPPVPMSLEETLLQLMGVSRPPSPEPIRAYRSPIRTLPHAPGSTGGSGGVATSGSTARASGSSGSGVVGTGGAVATGPRFLSVNPAVAGVSGNPRVEMHIAVVNRNGQVLSNTPVNNPTALSAVTAAAFSAGRPAAAPTPLTAATAAAAVATEPSVSQPSETSAAAAPGVDLSSVQSLHNRATSLLQQVQDISARSQQLNERTTAVTEYSNALHSIIRNINTVEEIRTSQRRINEINQQIETIRNRALAISATAAGIRERTAQVNAAADAITAATTTATASAFEGAAEATEEPDEESAVTANANAVGSRNDVDDDGAASDPPLALPDELDEEDGDSEYSADNVGEWEEEELYEEELELLESMQAPSTAVAQSVGNEDDEDEGEEDEDEEEEVLLDDLVPTARIDTLLGEGRGGAACAYASSAASIASSATGDVTERMNPSITERLQYYSTTTTAAATTTAGQVEDSEHPDSASHSLDDVEAAVVDDDNNDDDNSSSFSSCSEGRKNGDVSVDSDF